MGRRGNSPPFSYAPKINFKCWRNNRVWRPIKPPSRSALDMMIRPSTMTFHNPKEFTGKVGLNDGGSRKLVPLLTGRLVA